MRKMKFGILLAFAVLGLVGIVSAASPLTTLGGPISFPYNGDLVVTYVGQDAGYNNEFGIYNGGYVTLESNIHAVTPPKQYDVGRCSAGEPVVLYIKSEPGNYFMTDIMGGDGYVHADITKVADTFTVGFEDIYGDGADWDYNDVVLSVACTPDPINTPEFPTLALPVALIIGMIGVVLFIQKTKEE